MVLCIIILCKNNDFIHLSSKKISNIVNRYYVERNNTMIYKYNDIIRSEFGIGNFYQKLFDSMYFRLRFKPHSTY